MSSAKQANWNLGCSLLLMVVLVGAVLFYFRVKNTYNHTLQPGQSVEIRVRPRADQLEYSSELILEKKDTNRLKLSGSGVWFEMHGDIFYDVEGQNLFEAIIQKMLMKSCPIIKKISI